MGEVGSVRETAGAADNRSQGDDLESRWQRQVDPVVGLCCSGGGIRSAAFNLGALQVLQEQQELTRASWLAAVSGGSYIAGAFTMVQRSIEDGLQRTAADVEAVEKDIAEHENDPEEMARLSQRLTDLQAELHRWTTAPGPFAVGSPEVDLLRNNSRYIAPDPYHVVEIALRLLLGLAVNMVVLGSIIGTLGIGGGLLLGWVSHPLALRQHVYGQGTTHWLVGITLGVLGAGIAVFGTNVLYRWHDTPRKVTQMIGVALIAAAALCGFTTLFVPWLVLQLRQGIDLGFLGTLNPGSLAGASGAATAAVVAGVGAQSKSLVSQAEAFAKAAGSDLKAYQKLSQGLRKVIVIVVGTLVVPLLAVGALLVFVNLGVSHVDWRTTADSVTRRLDGYGVLALCLAVLAGVLLFLFGNLTTWSMHPYYRRRLSNAYALERTSPTTAMQRSYDKKVTLSKAQPEKFPKLLVCATANVTDAEVTPRGQNGVSFVFSAEELGYRVTGNPAKPLAGWVSTADFETWVGRHTVDVTLPAAIAMSGAALSPEMGDMTRSWLRAMMALGNIRLGVWLPNPKNMPRNVDGKLPRDPESHTKLAKGYHRAGRARVHHLLAELLGSNRIRRRFLYITDGGHWDNLGLVELLNRPGLLGGS